MGGPPRPGATCHLRVRPPHASRQPGGRDEGRRGHERRGSAVDAHGEEVDGGAEAQHQGWGAEGGCHVCMNREQETPLF